MSRSSLHEQDMESNGCGPGRKRQESLAAAPRWLIAGANARILRTGQNLHTILKISQSPRALRKITEQQHGNKQAKHAK